MWAHISRAHYHCLSILYKAIQCIIRCITQCVNHSYKFANYTAWRKWICLVKLIVLKYKLQLTLQYISFLLASKHIQHISSHSYIIWVPYTLIQDQVSKYLGISLPFLEIMFSNNLFLVQSSKYYIMKRRMSTLKQYRTDDAWPTLQKDVLYLRTCNTGSEAISHEDWNTVKIFPWSKHLKYFTHYKLMVGGIGEA